MMEYYFDSKCRLTNYHPCKVTLQNGLTFESAEAAYHSQKFDDIEIKKRFCGLSADDSKYLSKQLKSKVSARFNVMKYELMYEVIYAKFTQNEDCRKELLETGSAYLIEDTTGWCDNYWGRCRCPKCINRHYENTLGIALMNLREELRSI